METFHIIITVKDDARIAAAPPPPSEIMYRFVNIDKLRFRFSRCRASILPARNPVKNGTSASYVSYS